MASSRTSLAEGLNILHNANAGKRVAQSDAETAPMEKPGFYQFGRDDFVDRALSAMRKGFGDHDEKKA